MMDSLEIIAACDMEICVYSKRYEEMKVYELPMTKAIIIQI